MPHFSNHMSYHQIADALHHAHLASKILSSSEWECLSKSLENPLTLKLLELHPLPKTSQKVISETREQIIAREPQREHNAADNGVHSAIYGGEREKTAAYLKKTYPPAQSADWMERLSKFVREAIKTNTEVHEALKNAEKSRYHERESDRASIQEKARALNQPLAPYALPPETPVVSLEIIQADFIDYLKHLEKLKRQEGTYAWDVLQSLMQWYESRKTAEQKQDALVSLIIALDDARTAYHTHHRKYVTGTDYTCQRGLEERLLDRHAYLRPLEVKDSATPIEQTLLALTEPFLSRDAALEGCRATFSAELYRMYCEVAGYQIVKPEPIEIYALIEDIWQNDTELEEQYLSSLETSSPVSERMKDYHCKEFHRLLGSIHHKSLLASTKTTPALKFLQDQGLVRIISHQPEETLQQVGPEKTEAEIFDEMLERYPCFLGAAHLKLVLTLHNLYGRLDGDFETDATFQTLHQVAESGVIPASTRAIDSDSMIAAYSDHLSSQELSFYDFYPVTREDNDQLTEKLTGNLYQWPCSEDVFLQWMQNQERPIPLEQAQHLTVFSAKAGYTNALRVLLDPPYSVSSNYENSQERETLLWLAAQNGHTETVKVLIAAGAGVNHANLEGMTALMIAVYHGHTETVQVLIDAVDLKINLKNNHGDTALMWAVQNGHTEIVKALIAAGADVNLSNQHGVSALLCATQKGHKEIVQALIAAGSKINGASQEGMTALMIAVGYNYTEVARLLIDAGADVNLASSHYGHTALIWAAQKGHREIVQALITAHANLNLTNKNGDTALMWAVQNGHTEIVKVLIAAEADVNLVNQNGASTLLCAAQNGHKEIVQILITAHAHLNFACSNHGYTALMLTAQKGETDIVQALIDAGADVNLVSSHYGYTALIWAAQKGHREIVQALITAGANINHCNTHGVTALTWAARKGHTEIVQLLKNAQMAQIREQTRSCILSTQQSHEDRDSKNAKPL